MNIELTSEADLATRLGCSLDVLRAARENLTEGEHYERRGRAVFLTPAGVAELVGEDLAPKKKEGGAVRVVVAATGDPKRKLRMLRGRVQASGQICLVYLTGRGVLASQFRRLQEIDCTPHPERTDAFEFAGKPPRRLPL